MKKTLSLLVLFTLSASCWVTRDDQGKSSVEGIALIPVKIGVAAYNELNDIELTVEFVPSSRCNRITPLQTYRFVLKKQTDILVDQFLSGKSKVVRHPKLTRGTYEAQIFHQDFPQKMTRKNFNISEKSPILLLDVPCLD